MAALLPAEQSFAEGPKPCGPCSRTSCGVRSRSAVNANDRSRAGIRARRPGPVAPQPREAAPRAPPAPKTRTAAGAPAPSPISNELPKMRFAETAPKAQRPGGVPFSPSASKRTSREGKDAKDLKDLKAALKGLQATGPRAGLEARPKARKDVESGRAPRVGQEKELELDVRFDASGELRLRASGAGVDFRAPRGSRQQAEEEPSDVLCEDDDALWADDSATAWTDGSAFGYAIPLLPGEAPISLTLGLGEVEELEDIWDEDDELGEAQRAGQELPSVAEEKELGARAAAQEVQERAVDKEAEHRELLNRECASHFVEAVIASTLIQAVTGHRRLVTPRRAPPTMGSARMQASPRSFAKLAVPELDTAHLEAAGLAEMEQRLEAALDFQLSAPSSPAASGRPLPPLVPPSPPSPAAGTWEVYELEAGLHLQLSSPALPSSAASAPPQQPLLPAAFATPLPAEGSPMARQASRCGLRASKSHRRIIGGVIRTPVAESEHGATSCYSTERAAAAADPAAPRPQVRTADGAAGSRAGAAKASKSARQGRESPTSSAGHRGAAVVFRMDFDEPSMLLGSPEGNAAARGSSLAGRYEALGAELFSMQDEADHAQSALGDSLRHASSPSRSQSKGSISAMALDLGDDVARSSTSARAATPAASSHYQTTKCFKRSPSDHFAQKPRPSTQSGALRSASPASSTAAPKKQGLLPDLPSAPCSGSVAWTRRLNRPASRCSLAGRGALDAVF